MKPTRSKEPRSASFWPVFRMPDKPSRNWSLKMETHQLEQISEQVNLVCTDIKSELKGYDGRIVEIEKRLNRTRLSASNVPAGVASAEHKAIARYVRTDDATELKSMSVGSDPDGGYLVLPVMAQ